MLRYLLISNSVVVGVTTKEIPDTTVIFDTIISDPDILYNIGDTYILEEYTKHYHPYSDLHNTNKGSIMSNDMIWIPISGKDAPTILIDINDIRAMSRNRKYIYDGLVQAGFNITFIKQDYDYELISIPPDVLHNKVKLKEVQDSINIPTLKQYAFDKSILLSIEPINVIAKPIYGKGATDSNSVNAYKIFNSPAELVSAIGAEDPKLWESLKSTYIVEEAIVDSNNKTHKITITALVNGQGNIIVPQFEDCIWGPAEIGQKLELSVRDMNNPLFNIMVNRTQQLVTKLGIKNCCLFLQGVVRNGECYINDADIKFPVLYAKALSKYFPDHLKFVFDQQNTAEIPTEITATTLLTSIKGDKSTHLDLLREGATRFGTFFWIQYYFRPNVNRGSYLLISTADTKEQAVETLNNYVNFLTV